MGVTVEKLETVHNRIFGIYVGQHVGGVVRISDFTFLVRDIGGNDRRMIQRVATLSISLGQFLRVAAVQTHVRQGTDRGGTHVFT